MIIFFVMFFLFLGADVNGLRGRLNLLEKLENRLAGDVWRGGDVDVVLGEACGNFLSCLLYTSDAADE